ncbi:MAG: hypothetical protein OFPII_21590 [Osedax symbiont Rs1]|nr:MAG: hypothetical protein OFPII_21590 [Osedax symbiont Rs1]
MSKAEKLGSRKLIVLVLVLGLVFALVHLGFWQLDRAKQKELLIKQWLAPAISTSFRSLGESQNIYQKIKLKGSFNKEHYFWLDNKIRHGKVGYELVVLFELAADSMLAVNLGWVKGDMDRSVLPRVNLPTEEILLMGWLKKVEPAFQLKTDIWGVAWPKRIQQINFLKITAAMQSTQLTQLTQLKHQLIEPYVLLAEKPILSGLTTQWKPVNMSVEKHLGYAVQWFLMALVLCGMLIWYWRINGRETGRDPS